MSFWRPRALPACAYVAGLHLLGLRREYGHAYVETARADHQMSFYAATKKATEAMAHSYAHLYNLPITMFRFFTVYGPWGRPDMALFKFTKAILNGDAIDVYNHGDMKRDFTYIDDLVRAIRLLIDAAPLRLETVPEGDSLSPVAPFRVVNIGNSEPVQLLAFIEAIEAATGLSAQKNMMPMQAGDVPATWADARLLTSLTGYAPKTQVPKGSRISSRGIARITAPKRSIRHGPQKSWGGHIIAPSRGQTIANAAT